MIILRIIFKNKTIQFWAIAAALAVLAIGKGVEHGLSKSDWSGWAQAVGAFVAIFASGWIATRQSRRQFEDARRLQRLDRSLHALGLTQASTAIANHVLKQFMLVINQFGHDRDTFHDIAAQRRVFDRHMLAEMRVDLDAIPLHEISSAPVIETLLRMRSIVRQVTDNIHRGIDGHRHMDAQAFHNFFDMLDDAHLRFSLLTLELDAIIVSSATEN